MRFDTKPEAIFLIGITGGSCAGKTTFAQRLRDALGENYCAILSQDAYYHDQSESFAGGKNINFDDPRSIDFKLLHEHLLELQRGNAVMAPVYDFVSHRRLANRVQIFPTDIILVDGALILTQPMILELLSESIFLDVPESLRFQRRACRDQAERGFTSEGVLHQFNKHVKPMHTRYIEPTRHLATYQVIDEAQAQEVIDELVERLGVDSY